MNLRTHGALPGRTLCAVRAPRGERSVPWVSMMYSKRIMRTVERAMWARELVVLAAGYRATRR